MKIKYMGNEEVTRSKWSGGTTTQLAIHPIGGDYSNRDFIWRLSSAVVEVEKSIFTSLPNTERIIMILEGNLILSHEDRYEKRLKRFDQDRFAGDWHTSSVGKVTDFNLMMKGTARGCLDHQSIRGLGALPLRCQVIQGIEANTYLSKGFYCCEGSGILKVEGKDFTIKAGDLLMIEMTKDEVYEETVALSGQMELVIVELSY